ncbi:MAG: hypothetical protein PHT33_11875, partial [bacterium]|nr:hypothetical protein [bacterium]
MPGKNGIKMRAITMRVAVYILGLFVLCQFSSSLWAEDQHGKRVGSHYLEIEAEDFQGIWNLQRNIKGFSGTGFRCADRQDKTSDALILTFPVPEAGRYYVWVRAYVDYRQDEPLRDRRVQLEINGRQLGVTHAGTGGKYVWELAGTAQIERGITTVRILDAGSGYESVDAVVLTDDPDYIPAGVLEHAQASYPTPVMKATLGRPDYTGKDKTADLRIDLSESQASIWGIRITAVAVDTVSNRT